MALTNESQNTASLTNEEFGSSDITWDEANFTWDEAAGSWDNPYKMANEAQNAASITNESITP